MDETLIPVVFWAIVLLPVAIMFWLLPRAHRDSLSPSRAASRYFLQALSPLLLYGILFLILPGGEKIADRFLISDGYARSLFLIMGLGLVWVVVLTVLFVIIAFAIFMALKAMNAMQKAREEEVEEEPAPPEPSAEETLLTEIRDLLAKR